MGAFYFGSMLIQLLTLSLFGIFIYLLVLLIKLARRGITALDIYIEKIIKKTLINIKFTLIKEISNEFNRNHKLQEGNSRQ